MDIILNPGPRSGEIRVPASKSACHRLFILSSLGSEAVNIKCGEPSGDISATISCLNSLGADISKLSDGLYAVNPIRAHKAKAELFCSESGSTLRFLLALAGIFADEAVFHMEGRLSQRPIESFTEELCRHGMDIKRDENKLHCRGKLCPGNFSLPGNESSQYITSLLLALPLLSGDSRLEIRGPLQSAPYVYMTEELLKTAGIEIRKSDNTYFIPGNQQPKLSGLIIPEGDYSSASFFLAAGALSKEGIKVLGLTKDSSQGDRAVIEILKRIGAEVSIGDDFVKVSKKDLHALDIDAAQIPDAVPVLAALLSLAEGESRIYNAQRLRLKESDRLKTTCFMLKSLGADIKELPDGLVIRGRATLWGGKCQSYNDHRIAMAAAVAACGCENEVIVEDAQATNKSYPQFWQHFMSLKGENL